MAPNKSMVRPVANLWGSPTTHIDRDHYLRLEHVQDGLFIWTRKNDWDLGYIIIQNIIEGIYPVSYSWYILDMIH